MLLFPERIEKFFYAFDDFFLNLFQRYPNRILAQICKTITCSLFFIFLLLFIYYYNNRNFF